MSAFNQKLAMASSERVAQSDLSSGQTTKTGSPQSKKLRQDAGVQSIFEEFFKNTSFKFDPSGKADPNWGAGYPPEEGDAPVMVDSVDKSQQAAESWEDTDTGRENDAKWGVFSHPEASRDPVGDSSQGSTAPSCKGVVCANDGDFHDCDGNDLKPKGRIHAPFPTNIEDEL